jgi:hypothetical protein
MRTCVLARSPQKTITAPSPPPSTSNLFSPPTPPPPPPAPLLSSLDYETSEPPVADTVAPVIVLRGLSRLNVPLYSAYVDAGAVVTDNVDTGLAAAATGLLINTSSLTPTDAPLVVNYTASDSAGNKATPVARLVWVIDPCAPVERMCSETGSCSIAGSCSPGAGALTALFGTAAPPPPVAIDPDITPPIITLLGSGSPFQTPDGVMGLESSVFVGAGTYTDAGATAFDTVDRSLTASLQVSGAAEVDISRPTNTSLPFVVTYRVSDRAGNRATARRRVHVVCVSPEKICPDAGDGLFCSSGARLACAVRSPPVQPAPQGGL